MRPVEDIIGTKPDETRGLALFAAQREASPEAARPVARAALPGAKQAAREGVAPHLNALQAKVLAAITALGPITRERLAESLGMKDNTCRPRVKELLDAGRIFVSGYTKEPRCELLAVVPSPEEG